MQPLQCFAMSKSTLARLFHNFKSVGNCKREQQIKLPNATGPLMKEFLLQLFQLCNDIESSMKESSTKMAFYKHTYKDALCRMFIVAF